MDIQIPQKIERLSSHEHVLNIKNKFIPELEKILGLLNLSIDIAELDSNASCSLDSFKNLSKECTNLINEKKIDIAPVIEYKSKQITDKYNPITENLTKNLIERQKNEKLKEEQLLQYFQKTQTEFNKIKEIIPKQIEIICTQLTEQHKNEIANHEQQMKCMQEIQQMLIETQKTKQISQLQKQKFSFLKWVTGTTLILFFWLWHYSHK